MTSPWRPTLFLTASLFALPIAAPAQISAEIQAFNALTPAQVSADIEAHFHQMRAVEERRADPITGDEFLFVRLADLQTPQAWSIRRSINLRLMQAHHLNLIGERERAATLIREVQAMDPESINVRLALAGVLWDQGKEAEALSILRIITLDDPDNAGAQMELGLRLQESGQSPAAVLPLRRALDLRPGSQQIQQALAQALIESGKLKEGIEILQELVNSEPGNLYGILLLANAADRLGENEIALDSYERLIDARPDIWSSYQAIANIHRAEGDLDKALEALGWALIIEPEQPEINATLRTILRNEGGREAVLEFWSELTEDNRDNFELQMSYVRRLVNSGKTQEAQETLEQIVETSPNDPEPRRMLGAYMLAQDQVDEAIAHLRAAQALDPTDEDTIDTLIDILIERDQIDDALELVEESASPLRRARNHSHLAKAFATRSDFELAEQQHRAAITIAPEDPVIRFEHLNTLVERGDVDMGLEATLETIEAIGLNPELSGRTIPLYHMINQFKDAIDDENRARVESVLEEAVSTEPSSGALRSLAIFHHEWGNPERSRELLTEAWALDNNPVVRLRIIRIHLSQGDLVIAQERLNVLADEGLDTLEMAIWQGVHRWLADDREAAHDHWRKALQRSRSFEVANDAMRSISAEGWDDLGFDFAMLCVETLGIFHTTSDGDIVNVYSLTTRFAEQVEANRDEVEATLQRTMGDEPTGMEVAMFAQFQSESGNSDEAEALFLRAADMRVSEEDWKPLIAQIARDHGHLEASETIYRDAIAMTDVPSGALLAALGETLVVQERQDEAADFFRQALETEADDLNWIIFMGEITRDLNMTDLSEEFLLSAIREHPDNDDLLYQLGYTRDVGDRHAEAEEAFRQAIEINPENFFALNHMGYMFTELDIKLDEALDLIQRAVDLSDHADELVTGNAFIVDSLGWAHHRLGNHDQAVEWLREAIRRAERAGQADGVFHEHLGDALKAAGRDSEALSAWTEAVSLFEVTGEHANIVNVGAKIIELSPDNEAIRESVTRAEADLSETD